MSEKKFDISRGCFFVGSDTGDVSVDKSEGADKLNTYNWLEEIENLQPHNNDIFEVRFKNTRKGYYKNVNNLPLKNGDVVAVESSPGHDIGIVSLTGEMVGLQMKKNGFNNEGIEFKKIYRIAKPGDIEKWQEAIALEYPTMIKSRQIASSLELNMKIGDVEYQGDKIKAIFYYIADERVDFRELIKIFADQFRVRIEMKQIGARQEAGRIGGIGSCGRELCCSSWVSNFVSVTTNSARFQEISLNPQKLAGQCGKLKCCLNFEVDSYIDARKDFPRINAPLETLEGSYFLVKSDIFKREMGFSSDPSSMVNITTISVDRVREILRLNRKGVKVDRLSVFEETNNIKEQPDYKNVVGEESITRFDGNRKNQRRGNSHNRDRNTSRTKEDGGVSTVKDTDVTVSSNEDKTKNRGGAPNENKTSKNQRRFPNRDRHRPDKSVNDTSVTDIQGVSVPSPSEQTTEGGVTKTNAGKKRNFVRRNKNKVKKSDTPE